MESFDRLDKLGVVVESALGSSLARLAHIGSATVERMYAEFTRRKATERESLQCPIVLGIDEISTQLDETAACVEVPGIILQPLLENAIKHGRRTSPAPLKVALSIVMNEQGEVEMEVVNTGRWILPEESTRRPESGIGLENMRQRLAHHEEIVQVGEAEDAETALELCNSLQPDALFLDIEMGKANGFSLLDRLPAPLPGIVFVTAHEDFSLRVFEVDAVDYLLKPIGPARLEQAIRKLERFCNSQCQGLVVQGDRGAVVLIPATITHIEADGNYTQVYSQNETPVYVRRGITQWMEVLPPGHFVRVHRSPIVNRKLVRNIRSLDRELGELLLDGVTVPVTLKRRALLRLRHLFR